MHPQCSELAELRRVMGKSKKCRARGMLVASIARARPRLGGALQTVFGMLVAGIARARPRLGGALQAVCMSVQTVLQTVLQTVGLFLQTLQTVLRVF